MPQDSQGATMLKLVSGGGQPHFRFFQLSQDHARILWTSPKKSGKEASGVLKVPCNHSNNTVAVVDILEVRVGQSTPAFRKRPIPEHESISFSVMYKDGKEEKTLDIVCKDKGEHATWVTGLKSLTLEPESVPVESRGDPGIAGVPLQGSDTLQVQFRGGATVVHRTEMAADLYTCGDGTSGRLGHGDELDVLVPRVVEALLGRDVRKMACGSHTTVIAVGPGIFSWGTGSNGRLGHGHERDRFTPLLVAGSLEHAEIVDVACGDHHTLCLDSEGSVYSWGKGAHGRLGYPAAKQLVPKKVEHPLLKDVVQVACGYVSSATVLKAGELLTWGGGDKGQLGHPELCNMVEPTVIKALLGNPVLCVSCGAWHMACITQDGGVWTWGNGSSGKLGHGDEEDCPIPTRIGALRHIRATSVACGDYHTAILTMEGEVYTFGEGAYGQLGLGARDAQYTPQLVRFLRGVRSISCGSNHTAACTEEGCVYTWGNGVSGRLGHGDELDRLEPTAVEAMSQKQVQLVICGSTHTAMTITHGWVPDTESTVCMACKSVFTFLRRRHHCRHCGGLFCGSCSSKKFTLLAKGFNAPVRVCDKCHSSLTDGEV